MSSQHEQEEECGRSVGATVGREGAHGQGKGGKKGVRTEGSRVSLEKAYFLFGLSFELQTYAMRHLK